MNALTPVLIWLALVEHASLETRNPLDLILDEGCKMFSDITFFCELAMESFFVFAVLDAHGTFK